MSVKELITKIITEELDSTDNFLVGVDVNQAETDLKFYIDGIEGVSVQVCTRLSRKISRILDEEYLDDQPIRYEISSPGVDQPLVDKRQYPQHIGRDLMIDCTDESTVEGKLIEVKSAGIVLKVAVSKHKKEEQEVLFEDIKTSIVKISFKPRKK
ncbi:MAG: ribosome maturation factor RimP [Bacteroidia bacterium]